MLKHTLSKYVIAISLASIVSFSIGSSEAFAHYGEQLSGYGTAQIDGLRSLGEWDDAYVIPVFGGKSDASMLLVMNDENNLYIALYVIDNILTPNDQLGVMFDNSHNGILEVNDDSGGFSGLGSINDGHFNGTNWIVDSSTHGEGAAQNDGTRNFMEYSKPLKSGDVNDFDLSIGDTIGFCITYVREGIATDSTQYGPACRLLINEQNLYGDILLVPFSTTLPAVSTITLPASFPVSIINSPVSVPASTIASPASTAFSPKSVLVSALIRKFSFVDLS